MNNTLLHYMRILKDDATDNIIHLVLTPGKYIDRFPVYAKEAAGYYARYIVDKIEPCFCGGQYDGNVYYVHAPYGPSPSHADRRLSWMQENGYSLDDLMAALDGFRAEKNEWHEEGALQRLLTAFEKESGFPDDDGHTKIWRRRQGEVDEP